MIPGRTYHKILIIQPAFIGDVILATAVVEKLMAFYPAARIDFLLRKGNESLLQNNPSITRIFVWDKKRNKVHNLMKIIRQVRKERYDLVINLHRFASSGLITMLSGGSHTIGFDKNPFSLFFSERKKHVIDTAAKGGHEVKRNQSLIENITDPVPASPRLYPSKYDFEKVKLYKDTPYICVAPASVWFTKQYPAAKWAEFLNDVPSGYTIYLLGSMQDKNICAEIIAGAGRAGVVDLCGKLSFLESAALMKDAAMNYVNDSAPLHMTSAVNAAVCALFCSTVPAFGFGPLAEGAIVVEIEEPLSCRPCGLHGHKACPEGHFRCALGIRNEQLLRALKPIDMK